MNITRLTQLNYEFVFPMQNNYQSFSDYYAQKCTVCSGQKSVCLDGVWTRCICQQQATLEYRYSLIPIYPEELKYKNWSDFTGEIKDTTSNGRKETVGMLSGCGVVAKTKAMQYCFNKVGADTTKNRKQTLRVLDHLKDGQNVLIIGGSSTGKTLLAALINREVAYASYFSHRSIDFRWVTFSQILEAARWDNGREIDHTSLDGYSEAQFLTIDGVDVPSGKGHTTPPDMVAMNTLFGERLRNRHPTIVIMSNNFYNTLTHNALCQEIPKRWGDEFFTLLKHPNNVIIELQKE